MGQRRVADGAFVAPDVLDELLVGLSAAEVRELLTSLIEARQQLTAEERERLEAEASQLSARLHDLTEQQLGAELACFKEVRALQRRLLRGDGAG